MADVTVFVRGTKVVVRAEFRVPDEDGTLTDPTTVTFTAREREASSGSAYVYGAEAEVTRVSAGIFEFAKEHAEGDWAVHVQGTGAAHGAGEVSFRVKHSRALA